MSKFTMFVLAAMLSVSYGVAAKQPENKAVVADTPDKFGSLVVTIQQEMAPGKRYEFLNEYNRRVVNNSLQHMGELLTAAGSVDAMSPERKSELFSIQEKVNGILAKNADDRLVCSHSSPTGSHIPMTICHTVRELAKSRAASRDQFNDLANKANAAYTAESGGG